MAPKRGAKQAKLVNSDDEYKNLALADALCPICRYILVLPVTLPCSHNFCATCFEGTVANANLTCPLCRVRFASWLRIARKEDRLVNGRLWAEVQARFGDRVRNRQAGVEDVDEPHEAVIKLTSAGEIRREYEEQLRRDREALAKQRQAEDAASVALIQRLKAEDAALQVQERQRVEAATVAAAKEAALKRRPLDKLIQNMHKQLKAIPTDADSTAMAAVQQELTICVAGTSSCTSGGSRATGTSVPEVSGGAAPGEKSTKQKNLMHFTEVIEVSDSNDSIENECRYFKPIDYRNIPPSLAATPLKIPAVYNKHHSFKFESVSKATTISFSDGLSAFARVATHTSRKRKLSEKSSKRTAETEAHTMTLRDRKPSAASTSPPPPHLVPAATLLNGLKLTATATAAAYSKLEQERADLELAKKLQEQFNRERYATRSSITCRNNIKKPRQLTLTEIMSTSKCK